MDGKIDNKSFAEQFIGVRDEYVKLSTINGESVIDQDTPLWISQFLGFKFIKWYKVQKIKRQFEEDVVQHPEQITDDIDAVQNKIKRLEGEFMDVCKSMLEELEK